LKSAEDQLLELQQNIGNIQHFSDDGIRRSRQEAAKRRASDMKSSAERQATLQAEAGTVRAQLAKVRKDFWASESELRKVSSSTAHSLQYIYTESQKIVHQTHGATLLIFNVISKLFHCWKQLNF